jgi:hypothetical protein
MMKGKKKKNNQNISKPTKKIIQPEIGSFGSLLQSALNQQKKKPKTNKETTIASNSPKSEQKESILETKPKPIHPEIKDRSWEKNDLNQSLKIEVPSASIITQAAPNIKAEEFYFSQISEEFTEESELVIGLDFGTSCTKAIIRDNSLQLAYAVPFKGLDENNQPYLILTKLFVHHNGMCSLKNGDDVIDDAKIQLMDNPEAIIFTDSRTGDKITALEVSIAYIALILREIRYWFFDVHRDKYKNREFLWELNIGLPSRSYDDKVLHDTFKLLALAGWNVSTQTGKVSLDIVRQVLNECKRDFTLLAQNKPISIINGQIHPENVNAFPEVISEMVGYAKSPLRREGLHVLVDIGAGTTDITSFILYPYQDNDSYNLLTAEVERYGALVLHKYRLNKIKSILERKLGNLSHSIDGMSPLPKANDYLPSKQELNLDSIDDEFIKNFKNILKQVVIATKHRKDPNSDHWRSGLPVFLCGGGSQLEIYKNAIAACSETLIQTIHIAGFDIKNIPKPEGLEAPGLLEKNYHRLAVAYGLSHTADDIGRVIPPRQMKDIAPYVSTRDYTENYIGSEMM